MTRTPPPQLFRLGLRTLFTGRDAPAPPPPNFKVLPVAHSGSETPGTGAPGRTESGADSQALAGSRQRQEVSEGSLLTTGQAYPEHSGARGAKREEDITSAQDRVGGGSGVLLERTQERRTET